MDVNILKTNPDACQVRGHPNAVWFFNGRHYDPYGNEVDISEPASLEPTAPPAPILTLNDIPPDLLAQIVDAVTAKLTSGKKARATGEPG